MCPKRFSIKCLIDLFGHEKVAVMMRPSESISGMVSYFFSALLSRGLSATCTSVNQSAPLEQNR